MDLDGVGENRRVFHRLGPNQSPTDARQQKVCFHWRAGKCTRFPCHFLHRELPPPSFPAASSSSSPSNGHLTKRGFSKDSGFSGPPASRWPHNNSFDNGASSWGRRGGNDSNTYKRLVQKTEKVCNYWAQSNCSYGEKCRYLHSWSLGDGFSFLAQLDGHTARVSGIAMSAGKLYTGSLDKTVRVWDCGSGKCMGEVNVGEEIGCIMSEGPWVFVGVTGFVKAWNTQTNSELSLSGPGGQVYALAVGSDFLFAGTQDGAILAWKFNLTTNNFEPAASLTGHIKTVVSLVVGANRLFSASMDHSIQVWNLETLQCVQTLTEHASAVMSVLCWDQFLLSCSLDKTIKVWAVTESGSLEVTYTHNEEHGLLALYGMMDLEGKPVLLCSCNDNTVHLYDLPSFSERGKIFAKQDIRVIRTGPGGLFFTGDGSGQVRVWTCVAEPAATA